jgi:sensor domain CHASE-containing protein
MAMVLGFVWYSADRQDEIAIDQSVAAVDFTIRDQLRQIGAVAQDFSWSNDSVRHLDIAFSHNWADSNLGYYIHGEHDYDLSFVIDREGDTIYAHMNGRRVVGKAEDVLSGGLEQLITQTLDSPWREPVPATGLLANGQGIVMVGVCAVSLEPGSNINMVPGRRVVVVLAKRLTTDYLASVAGALHLKDVQLLVDQQARTLGALPLVAPNGTEIANLSWTAYQPGQSFLESVAPSLVVAMLVILAFTWLLIWQVRSSTRVIAHSEARFRDVADASSDWIWETDSKDRLRYLSDRFAESTGNSLDDMLGQPIGKLLKPSKTSDQIKTFNRIKDQKHFRNLTCL